MKKLKLNKAWILLCSVVVFTSAVTEHSSYHNGLPYHRNNTPRRRKLQTPTLPVAIQMPEHVLSTQNLSCISADRNIFDIMNEAKDNCRGKDMVCTFYLFDNHKYYKIGASEIDKELFDDLLMKYDNWLLTAENLHLKDAEQFLQNRYLKLYSNKLGHKGHLHSANTKNKLGRHDNFSKEKDGKSADVSRTFYIDKFDHDIDYHNALDGTNDSDDSDLIKKENTESINPVDINLKTTTNNDNRAVIDVVEKEGKTGNYIKLHPKYDNARKYFEVFLPKDKEHGQSKTINVEINNETDDHKFYEEEFDENNEHRPLEIECKEDTSADSELDLNITDNAWLSAHSSTNEHENENKIQDQKYNHDQDFKMRTINTDIPDIPVVDNYVTDNNKMSNISNFKIEKSDTDLSADNIPADRIDYNVMNKNTQNHPPLVHNLNMHKITSAKDEEIVVQNNYSTNDYNLKNIYHLKNDIRYAPTEDASDIVEPFTSNNIINSPSDPTNNNDVFDLKEICQETSPQEKFSDTLKDMNQYQIHLNKLEDCSTTDNAIPQINDDTQTKAPYDFDSKICNFNGYQKIISGDTTRNRKKIVNLSQNVVVPNKYINQAKYYVESEFNNNIDEKITNNDIPTNKLEETSSVPPINDDINVLNANIKTVGDNDTLEAKLNEITSKEELQHLEAANIVSHNTNNSMDHPLDLLNIENSLVENVDRIGQSTDIEEVSQDMSGLPDDIHIDPTEHPHIYSHTNFDDTHDFSMHNNEILKLSNIHHNEPIFGVVKPFRENNLKTTPYIFALPKSYLSHPHTEISDFAASKQDSFSKNQPIDTSSSNLISLLGSEFSKNAEPKSQLKSLSSFPLPALINSLSELDGSQISPDFGLSPSDPSIKQFPDPMLPVLPIESVMVLNVGSESSPLNVGFSWLPSHSRIEELRLPNPVTPLAKVRTIPPESSTPITAPSIKEFFADTAPISSSTDTMLIDSDLPSFGESYTDNSLLTTTTSISEPTTSAVDSDIISYPLLTADSAIIPTSAREYVASPNSNVGLNLPNYKQQNLQSPSVLPSIKASPISLGTVNKIPLGIKSYVPRGKHPLLANTNQYPYVKIPQISPQYKKPLHVNSLLPASEFPLDSLPISLLDETDRKSRGKSLASNTLASITPLVSNLENLPLLESDFLQSSPMMYAEPSLLTKIPQNKILPKPSSMFTIPMKKNFQNSLFPTLNSDLTKDFDMLQDEIIDPSSNKASLLDKDSSQGHASSQSKPQSSLSSTYTPLVVADLNPSTSNLPDLTTQYGVPVSIAPNSPLLDKDSSVTPINELSSTLPTLPLTISKTAQVNTQSNIPSALEHDSGIIDPSSSLSSLVTSHPQLAEDTQCNQDENIDLTAFQPLESSLTPSKDLGNIPVIVDSSTQSLIPTLQDTTLPYLNENTLQITDVDQATQPIETNLNMVLPSSPYTNPKQSSSTSSQSEILKSKNQQSLLEPVHTNLKENTNQIYEEFNELPSDTNKALESHLKSPPRVEISPELISDSSKLIEQDIQLQPITLKPSNDSSLVTESLASPKSTSLNTELNIDTAVSELVPPNYTAPSLTTKIEPLLVIPTTTEQGKEPSQISPTVNRENTPLLDVTPNENSITSSSLDSSPQSDLKTESILMDSHPEEVHLDSNILESSKPISSLIDTSPVVKPISTQITPTTEFPTENTYSLPVDSPAIPLPPTLLSSSISSPSPSVNRRLSVSNISKAQEILQISSVLTEYLPVETTDGEILKPPISYARKIPLSPISNSLSPVSINPMLDESIVLEPIPMETPFLPLITPYFSSSPSPGYNVLNINNPSIAATPQSYNPSGDSSTLLNIKVPHSPRPTILSPSDNPQYNTAPVISSNSFPQSNHLPPLISLTDQDASFPSTGFTIVDIKPISIAQTLKPLVEAQQYPSISVPQLDIPLSVSTSPHAGSIASPILSSKLTEPSLEQVLSAAPIINPQFSPIPVPQYNIPKSTPLPTATNKPQFIESELQQLNDELLSPIAKTSSIDLKPLISNTDLQPIYLDTPSDNTVSLLDNRELEASSQETPLTILPSQGQTIESTVNKEPFPELSSLPISGNKAKSLNKPLNVDFENLQNNLPSVASSPVSSQYDTKNLPFIPQIILEHDTLPTSLLSQTKPLLLEENWQVPQLPSTASIQSHRPISTGKNIPPKVDAEPNAHSSSISNTLLSPIYEIPLLDTSSVKPNTHTPIYIKPISKLDSITPSPMYTMPSNLWSLDNIRELPKAPVSSFPNKVASTILGSKYNPTSQFDIKDEDIFQILEDSLETLPPTHHAITSTTLGQGLLPNINEFPDLGESLFQPSKLTPKLASSNPIGQEIFQPDIITIPTQIESPSILQTSPSPVNILPIPSSKLLNISQLSPIHSNLPTKDATTAPNPRLSLHPYTYTLKKPSPLSYFKLPLDSDILKNIPSRLQDSLTTPSYETSLLLDSPDLQQNIEIIQYPVTTAKDKPTVPNTLQDITSKVSNIPLSDKEFTQTPPILDSSSVYITPELNLNYAHSKLPKRKPSKIVSQYKSQPSLLQTYNNIPLDALFSQNLGPIIQLDESLNVLDKELPLSIYNSPSIETKSSQTSQPYLPVPESIAEDISSPPPTHVTTSVAEDSSKSKPDSVPTSPFTLKSPPRYSNPMNTDATQTSRLELEFIQQQNHPTESSSEYSRPLLLDALKITPSTQLLDDIPTYGIAPELLESTSSDLDSEFIQPSSQLAAISKQLLPTASSSTQIPTYPIVQQYDVPCPILSRPVLPVYQSLSPSLSLASNKPLSRDFISSFSPADIPTSALTRPVSAAYSSLVSPDYPIPLSPAYPLTLSPSCVTPVPPAYINPLLSVCSNPLTAHTSPSLAYKNSLSPTYLTPLSSEYPSKSRVPSSQQISVSPSSLFPALIDTSSPLYASPLSPLYTSPQLPTYLNPVASFNTKKLSPFPSQQTSGSIPQPFTTPFSVSYADRALPAPKKPMTCPYITQAPSICTNPIFNNNQHLPISPNLSPIYKPLSSNVLLNKQPQITRPESQILRPMDAPPLSYSSNPFMNINQSPISPCIPIQSYPKAKALPLSPVSSSHIDTIELKRPVEDILLSSLPISSLIQPLTISTPTYSSSDEIICTDSNVIEENYSEEPCLVSSLESTPDISVSEAIGTLLDQYLAQDGTSVPCLPTAPMLEKLYQSPRLFKNNFLLNSTILPLLGPTLVPSQLTSTISINPPIIFENMPTQLSLPFSPAFMQPESQVSSMPLFTPPISSISPLIDIKHNSKQYSAVGKPRNSSSPILNLSAPSTDFSETSLIPTTTKYATRVPQVKPQLSQFSTVEPVSVLPSYMKPISDTVASPVVSPKTHHTVLDTPENYMSLSPIFSQLTSNTPSYQSSVIPPSARPYFNNYQTPFKSPAFTKPLLDTFLQKTTKTKPPTAPQYIPVTPAQNILQNTGFSPLIPMSLKSQPTFLQKHVTSPTLISPSPESDILEMSSITPDFLNIPSLSQTLINNFPKKHSTVPAYLQPLSLLNSSVSLPALLPVSAIPLSTDLFRPQQSVSSTTSYPKSTNIFQTAPNMKISSISNNPRYTYPTSYTKPIEITDFEQIAFSSPSATPISYTHNSPSSTDIQQSVSAPASIPQSSSLSPIYTQSIETSDTSYQSQLSPENFKTSSNSYEILSLPQSYITPSLATGKPISLAQQISHNPSMLYRNFTVPDISIFSSPSTISFEDDLSPEIYSSQIIPSAPLYSSSLVKPFTATVSPQKSPTLQSLSPYSLYVPQSLLSDLGPQLPTAHVSWLPPSSSSVTNSIPRPLPSGKTSSTILHTLPKPIYNSQHQSPVSILPNELEDVSISPQLSSEPLSLSSASPILKYSSTPIIQYGIPHPPLNKYTSIVPWWNTKNLPSALVPELVSTVPDTVNTTPIQFTSASPIPLPEETIIEDGRPTKGPQMSVSKYDIPDSFYSVLDTDIVEPTVLCQSMYPILNVPPFNEFLPITESILTAPSSSKPLTGFSGHISPHSSLSPDDSITYLPTELFQKATSSLQPVHSMQSDLSQFTTLSNSPSNVISDLQVNTYDIPIMSDIVKESDTNQKSGKYNAQYNTFAPLLSSVSSTLEYSDLIRDLSSSPKLSSPNLQQPSWSSRSPLDSSLIGDLNSILLPNSLLSPPRAGPMLAKAITQHPLHMPSIQNFLPFNEKSVEITPYKDILDLTNQDNYIYPSSPLEIKGLKDEVPVKSTYEVISIKPVTPLEAIIYQSNISDLESAGIENYNSITPNEIEYTVCNESSNEADVNDAEIIHNTESFNKLANYLFGMPNRGTKLNQNLDDISNISDVPSNNLQHLNKEVPSTNIIVNPLNIKPIADKTVASDFNIYAKIIDNIVHPDNIDISDRIPESYTEASLWTPQDQNSGNSLETLSTTPLQSTVYPLTDQDLPKKESYPQFHPFIRNPSNLSKYTSYTSPSNYYNNPSTIKIHKPTSDKIANFKMFPQNSENISKRDDFYANNHIGKSPEVINIPTVNNIDSDSISIRPNSNASPEIRPDCFGVPSEVFGPPPKISFVSMAPNKYYTENPDIVTADSPISIHNPIVSDFKSSSELPMPTYEMLTPQNGKDFTKYTPDSTPSAPYNNVENIKYSGYKTYQISSKPSDLYGILTPSQIYNPTIITQPLSAIPLYQNPISNTNIKMSTPLHTKLDLNNLPQGLKSNEFQIEDIPICENYIDIMTTPLQTKLGFNDLAQSSKSNEYSPIEDTPVCENNIDIDNELKTSIINYINHDKDLKDKLNDHNDKLTIPFRNIVITKREPFNDYTIQTKNPSIGLKVWKSNVKVIEAEIKLKVKDLSVTNFMPVVNNLDEYDIKEIRKIVKNYIDEKYGNHIEVNEPYEIDNQYTIIKDFDQNSIDNKYNILWPTDYV